MPIAPPEAPPAAPVAAPAPPKPASVAPIKDQSLGRLEKLSGPKTPEPAAIAPVPEPKPAEPPKPVATPKPEEKPAEAPKVEAPKVEPKPEAKERANPWKLYDAKKKENEELKTKLSQFESGKVQEGDKKQYLSQIEQLTKRNTELENEMRFVDYSKSTEFTEKYHKPYEKAWQNATAELKEIPVLSDSGEQRAATATDLLELVNLPLATAHELAAKKFGDFAPEAMAHRKEIRKLYDAQSEALKEAREKGMEREKTGREMQQHKMTEIQKHVQEAYEKAMETATKDPALSKFFAPIEGDDEGNTRLEKGYQFVQKAFEKNALDPRLSPEERAEVVKQQAAVRNRAAAFSRMKLQIGRLEEEKSALAKELAQFRQSEPPSGGSQPAPKPGANDGKGIEGSIARLGKYTAK